MYLLDPPQRGDSKKCPRRMFSQRITRDCQQKYTRSADFCADRIDVITNVVVITNFAVITIVVIKRVHCTSSDKGHAKYLRINIRTPNL